MKTNIKFLRLLSYAFWERGSKDMYKRKEKTRYNFKKQNPIKAHSDNTKIKFENYY